MEVDLSLFGLPEIERLLADVERNLRLMAASVAQLSNFDVPAPRLIYIAELEDKRARYQQRIAELRGDRSTSVAPGVGGVAGDLRPVRILFLAAGPRDRQLLAIDEEVRAIEQELRAVRGRSQLVLDARWAVRPDDLLRELAAERHDVIHFSGHAHDGELFLNGEEGQAAPVTAAPLADLLRAHSDSIRMVVLNACTTESLARQLAAVVPCVVAMNGAVEDQAALAFAKAFYRALAFGLSVQNAFIHGMTAIRFADLSLPVAPILVARPDVDLSRAFLT